MPFKSRKQMAWAFANKEPFAEQWAQMTPNIKDLPEYKGDRKDNPALPNEPRANPYATKKKRKRAPK